MSEFGSVKDPRWVGVISIVQRHGTGVYGGVMTFHQTVFCVTFRFLCVTVIERDITVDRWGMFSYDRKSRVSMYVYSLCT